jgi:hypothetical protein
MKEEEYPGFVEYCLTGKHPLLNNSAVKEKKRKTRRFNPISKVTERERKQMAGDLKKWLK